MRSTHTYAELEISKEAYDEIRDQLARADYHHAFIDERTIDMHGLAVVMAPAAGITREEAVRRAQAVHDGGACCMSQGTDKTVALFASEIERAYADGLSYGRAKEGR